MSFILRILFSGMIAFVPNTAGTEVTVLLLNVDHSHHASDGTSVAQHKPLLIARAGNCVGECPKRDTEVAQFIFSDQTQSVALDSIEGAVGGGGAWVLDGSELSLRKGSTNDPDLPALDIERDARGSVNGQLQLIPTTSTEREDFTWVANLRQICPSACTLKSSLFGSQPPSGLVAARFRLQTGKLFSHSVARIGSSVTPVHFERLDGTGSASPYTQVITSWVGADIAVSGSSIELVEEKFDGGTGRSMKLTPDSNGTVEVAVLNLPPFMPPSSPDNNAPEVGKHFELYYDLADTPPASATRLVPRMGAAPGAPSYPSVSWTSVHPQSAVYSDLLNSLRLDIGRGPYDRVLCPPAQDDDPPLGDGGGNP